MNFRLHPLVVLLACLYVPGARAGDAGPTALVLGEVQVQESAVGPLEPRQVLTSVDVLSTERIARLPVANNWELFGQVPGVMLTQFNQGTTSGKFSMRGFNGEGEINAVKLLIDGVPSNSNDGNMPYIDLVPRLDLESIEVVRGTNDPRYGLHNIAGNANMRTRIGGNYLLGQVSGASVAASDQAAGVPTLSQKEVQLAYGHEEGPLAQNYALALQSGHGYRAHSNADSGSFSGKWFVSPGQGDARIGLIVRQSTARADEAGYLTGAQVRQDPGMSPSYNRTDEDRRSAGQYALQAESALGAAWYGTVQLYLNTLQDRRFVRYSANVSQQERIVNETHTGGSASLTWRAGATPWGDLAVTGGVDAEHQDNRSQRYTTIEQLRQSQTRNQAFSLDTTGAYVQAQWKPLAALSITPAYRVDRIDGSYTNLLNGKTYAVNDYGNILQPKLSAVYALAPGNSLYANWGRSFQVGVGTASYKVNQTSDLSPSINEGLELGLRFKPLGWLEGRVAVWRQTASNEARRKLNDPSNDSENIGQTRRQGVDVQLNAQPTPQLALWVGAAVQRSEILKADSSNPGTEGNEIDHVPHLLYNLGADYRIGDAWRVSAWLNGQTSYYLERTNSTGRFGGYALANLAVNRQLTPALGVEVQLRNVFDRYSEYVWYDGSQALHAPGTPRTLYASLNLRY